MNQAVKIYVEILDEHRMRGDILEYSFEIERTEDPSDSGINGGKITKLILLSKVAYTVYAQFDRGWDKLPYAESAQKAIDLICGLWN